MSVQLFRSNLINAVFIVWIKIGIKDTHVCVFLLEQPIVIVFLFSHCVILQQGNLTSTLLLVKTIHTWRWTNNSLQKPDKNIDNEVYYVCIKFPTVTLFYWLWCNIPVYTYSHEKIVCFVCFIIFGILYNLTLKMQEIVFQEL